MEFMNEFISDFHFLRPMLLLALIPAAALFFLLLFISPGKTAWTRAVDPALLPHLLDRTRTHRQNGPLYGLLLLWTLGIVALAGPVWQQIPTPVQEREDALVVVMDLSLSMYADDLSPDRITRARRKLMDILDTRDEGLTGLVVYAGDAHTVTPLTEDAETIRNLVSSLNPDIMPAMGSKPVTGIRQALELLDNGAIERAQILLMTDGIREGDIPVVDEALAGTGHTLSVLGFGTAEGAPIPMQDGGFLRDQQDAIVIPKLDRTVLQSLARVTGGRYADARLTDEDIDYLLDESVFEQNANLVASEREFDTWQETGPWLVLVILPFAALAFRRGWLLGVCLAVILLPPRHAQAFEWEDLWQNRDQQGREVFEQEDFEQAARLFQDSRWQAAAHYRRGDYARAAESLNGLDDAEAHYNRGNALARMNRFQEAIDAYDAALEQDPDHADASHNKAVLEELLAEQQPPENGGQSQDSGDQNGQQQQQEGEQQQQQGQQQANQEQQQQQSQQDQQNQPNGQDQNQQQARDQQEQQEQDGRQQQQGRESEPRQEEGDNRQQQQQAGQRQQARNQEEASEEEQSMQQWLRRIPDDPGELLRNKFEYQTQQRLLDQLQNPDLVEQSPEEQIW